MYIETSRPFRFISDEEIPIASKIIKEEDKVEMEGPYRCPSCNGQMILDASFLDQVSDAVRCPYCEVLLKIPDLGE